MSDRIDRIRAIVNRAKQHIQDFQLGLTAFYDSRPYEISTDEQTEPGERLYRLVKVNAVPHPLTTIAADVIQNLRGPLDILAYQLVLDANGGTHPAGKDVVYYPITSAASEYRALRARNIKGVRQEVIDAIDATEPYPSGKGHALWQLNELNKFPKHKDLLSTASVQDGVDFRTFRAQLNWDHIFGPELWDSMPTLFLRPAESSPLDAGDVLVREPASEKVDDKRKFSIAVTLHAPGIIEREAALNFFKNTANLVDSIVTSLGKFLP